MTGPEFAALLARTHWSARAVAKRLRLAHGTIGDMTTGRIPPDPTIARYLERVAELVERIDRIPVPQHVDRRRRD